MTILKELRNLVKNCYIVLVLKILAVILVVLGSILLYSGDRLDSYKQEKVYDYRNDFSAQEIIVADLSKPLEQTFLSKGQDLTSISLYIQEIKKSEAVLNIKLKDSSEQIICESNIPVNELESGNWNKLDLDATGLKRGEIYTLCVYGTHITTVLDVNPMGVENLLTCYGADNTVKTRMAIGIHQIYRYVTLPYALLFGIDLLLLATVASALIYVILNIEKCMELLKKDNKKRPFFYAIVLSISVIMLYNPMAAENTSLESFSRVIGHGIVSGYDVSRVISNFNRWFLEFALLLGLAACFVAWVEERVCTKEAQEALNFLDDFMTLAGVNLILRGITFLMMELFRVMFFIIQRI